MPNNLPDKQKSYQPSPLFEYTPPDLPQSTSEEAEKAAQTQQQKAVPSSEEAEEFKKLSLEEQIEAADQMAIKKEEEKKKTSDVEETVTKLAASTATKIPYIGWIIKIVASLIVFLKSFVGEKVAAFVAFFIISWILLAPMNLILPFIGTILQFVLSGCFALILPLFFWNKLKPFIEAAGQTNIIPNKK